MHVSYFHIMIYHVITRDRLLGAHNVLGVKNGKFLSVSSRNLAFDYVSGETLLFSLCFIA